MIKKIESQQNDNHANPGIRCCSLSEQFQLLILGTIARKFPKEN